MTNSDQQCCICGRALPNRYAVAGTCEETGCEAVFCDLHWRHGNRRCPAHGWQPNSGGRGTPVSRQAAEETEATPATESESAGKAADSAVELDKENATSSRPWWQRMWNRNQESTQDSASATANSAADAKQPEEPAMSTKKDRELAKNAPKPVAKTAMKNTLELLRKTGGQATGLLAKLRKDTSPETMLETFDGQIARNKERREEVSSRLETLHKDIVAKKKEREKAAPARKRVLDMELKNLLSSYKDSERELGVLLENERVVSRVRGRFLEMLAYDMRGISEDQVDNLVEDLDEKAGEADAVMDAVRDLDRAGRRREEDEEDNLDDLLAGFEEEPDTAADEAPAAEPAAKARELDDFDEPEPDKPKQAEEEEG